MSSGSSLNLGCHVELFKMKVSFGLPIYFWIQYFQVFSYFPEINQVALFVSLERHRRRQIVRIFGGKIDCRGHASSEPAARAVPDVVRPPAARRDHLKLERPSNLRPSCRHLEATQEEVPVSLLRQQEDQQPGET